MNFLKKLFKKEKKYKIILDEDEMLIIGAIILMWIEDWKKDMKESDYDNYNKGLAERDIKLGWSMISKIRKAKGLK